MLQVVLMLLVVRQKTEDTARTTSIGVYNVRGRYNHYNNDRPLLAEGGRLTI